MIKLVGCGGEPLLLNSFDISIVIDHGDWRQIFINGKEIGVTDTIDDIDAKIFNAKG